MNGYLRPLRGRVDRRHIAQATIAVVGIGRVGALIVWELARLGLRRLILIDGDDYQEENRSGHPLPRKYVDMNKAMAMAAHLDGEEIPGLENVNAVPFFVTDELSDQELLEDVLEPADLVVVATHDLEVQRRVALLAREVAVSAVVPGVAEDGERGEVFVSLTEEEPCIRCFDDYRPAGDPVRGAALIGPDVYPTVQLAVSLCLGLLDRSSREADLFSPLFAGDPPPQLFRAWPPGARDLQVPDDGRTEIPWRADCPGCAGLPAATRSGAAHRPAQPNRRRPDAAPRGIDELQTFIRSHPRGTLAFLVAAGALLVFSITSGSGPEAVDPDPDPEPQAAVFDPEPPPEPPAPPSEAEQAQAALQGNVRDRAAYMRGKWRGKVEELLGTHQLRLRLTGQLGVAGAIAGSYRYPGRRPCGGRLVMKRRVPRGFVLQARERVSPKRCASSRYRLRIRRRGLDAKVVVPRDTQALLLIPTRLTGTLRRAGG